MAKPMVRLEVGQAYPLPIAGEGGHYSYRGQHDLLLAFAGLTRREIEDVRRGPAEFGLFGSHGLLFFLYRFGSSVGWGDCPYCWHLESTMEVPETPTGEQRILLPVTLVELPANIVRALRGITLSAEFSRLLVEKIREQSACGPMNRKEYTEAIDAVYREHTVDAMVTRAMMRCRGGV